MPKFRYRCKSCEKDFFLFHAAGVPIQNCIHCQAEHPTRIPNYAPVTPPPPSPAPIGSLVKEFIEEARQDLRSERENREEFPS